MTRVYELKNWIERYYRSSDVEAVMALLTSYGQKEWHREPERVRRDCVIISKGSFEKLKETVALADVDYRDVLVSEEVDPWVMHELKTIQNFLKGFDHYGAAVEIMGLLEKQGQGSWKKSMEDAIAGGATGTETLLRLGQAVRKMLKEGREIGSEIREKAKKLGREIDKTLNQ